MMRWEKVQVNPVQGQGGEGALGPGKRWGHTCEAIKGGELLYLFGGYGQDNCHTNQVHVFDTGKQTWSQPVIKGVPPSPRDSHTCTAVGDNLFIFGGTDGRNPLKDLHILDTSSHTWISPTIRGEGPKAREGHSAACVGRRLFIFGGCGKSAENNIEVYYNDLYILNTETFIWKYTAISGTPPSPRDSHTCSSLENKVIVIGGEDGHGYYLSDVHILDTDTLIWRKLNTSGQLLPPRAGHSTVALGKNLFVFGGFTDAQSLYDDLYKLDIDSGIWTKVTTTGHGPSARFSVAGSCLDPFKSGVLVFIGGCNKSLEALDEMYYLYTEFASGTEQRLEKLSLRKQLKLKCQEHNLNSLQDRASVRYGVGADDSPPVMVFRHRRPSINITVPLPPGGKRFQAKITESISGGFTIKTVIDGKRLRGFLFSNKPVSLHPASHTSSRKRTAGEIGNVYKLKTFKALKKDEMKDRQADGVHGDGSASHEHCTEAVAAPISSNLRSSNASEPHKVSINPEPEAFSLNRDDDNKNDTAESFGENSRNGGSNDVPISKTEATTNDQTNDAPSSNYENPRHDQTDAPHSNTEVLNPAAAESAVCLSNQDEMTDCTTPGTEEHSEPAKSIRNQHKNA